MYRSVKTYTNSASKRGIAAKSGSCARPVPQSNYGDNARKSHCQKRMARLPSMRLPCHLRAALADEEVEIGALMRLHDMVDVELGVAAVVVALRRLPSGRRRSAIARG